uniref:Aspartokinase n=1 Tax=Hematodinium sp. SG-2015 TaxID=1649283 RepID=A0A0F7C9M3_9DINO|nr:LysC [Hematodinium sp. SG-2015]
MAQLGDIQAGEARACCKTSPIVMKFGGSSIATGPAIRRVANIAHSVATGEHPIVVVLSAMGGTTNALIKVLENARNGSIDISSIRTTHEQIAAEFDLELSDDINKLFNELELVLRGVMILQGAISADRARDLVVSYGERISVRLFAAIYGHLFPNATCLRPRAYDAWEIGFITCPDKLRSGACRSVLVPDAMEKIARSLAEAAEQFVPIVTGFIARDEEGNVTTLGRDGSDLSASIIGAALKAKRVEIWKDVAGILTADPRIVPNARPVTEMTFEEVQELTYFGSKVVHPQAILPVIECSIPMVVKNSKDPSQPGTRIVSESTTPHGVRAISCKRQVTLVDIVSTRMLGQHGFLSQVFMLFDEFEISVDTIATSEVSISLTLDKCFDNAMLQKLESKLLLFAEVTVTSSMSLITLIAPKELSNEVLRRSFEIFRNANIPIEMVSHGASKVNLSFLVEDKIAEHCVLCLHEEYFGKCDSRCLHGDDSSNESTVTGSS